MKKLWMAGCLLTASTLSHSVDVSISTNSIVFSENNADNISISVSGPENFNDAFKSDSGFIEINIQEINQSKDGTYQFDATATSVVGSTQVSDNNGRGSVSKNIVTSDGASGHFRIDNGEFIVDSEVE